MRVSVGYHRLLIKAGALLATTATAAASLLFAETPESSAQTTEPTSYTPHLITVSPTNELTSTINSSGFNYGFGDVNFETIEEKLRTLRNSNAPFQDACWYDTEVSSWINDATRYKNQTCFTVQSITYANDDAGKRLVVAPADAIKYPGNDGDIELSAPIGDNETAQDVINKHVVFRFAEPTLTTRFTYYLESGNPNSLTLAGAGMQKISDKDGHQRYTQLVPKASVDVSTYTANVTVSSSRSSTQAIDAYNSDTHAGNTHQVAGGDISTVNNTIQRWSVPTTENGFSPNFLVSTQTKTGLTISASVANDKYFFTNDSSSEKNRSFDKGGTPAFVRKIFSGTGTGNNASVNSGTATTAGNSNGCTINGVKKDCSASLDTAPPSDNNRFKYDQIGKTHDRRMDNCTFGYASGGCDWDETISMNARYRHLLSGAGGGCFKGVEGIEADVNYSSDANYEKKFQALINNDAYSAGTESNLSNSNGNYGRYACTTPTNADSLNIGNYSSSNSIKVWFDHVENTSFQEEIYNKFLTEVWINGESIQVPFPKICTDQSTSSLSGFYISNEECRQIASDYAQLVVESGAQPHVSGWL